MMDIKKILGNIGCAALGTVAPPFGGMAASALKEVLGLKKNASEKEIVQGLRNATPEQVTALKKAENDFKLKMEKLGVDILEIDQKDRSSARDMKLKTKSIVPEILSIVITMGFFGTLYFMITETIPETAPRDAIIMLIGALGTAWTGIVAFWFGSSHGSKQKTTIIGDKK